MMNPIKREIYIWLREREFSISFHLDTAVEKAEVATCAADHVGPLEGEEVPDQDHTLFPAPNWHLEPLLSRLEVIENYLWLRGEERERDCS